ncbi:FAD:protein FMN transferase [Vibrio rumoiensis]|uniref:FAD:protein FMN transferase n=1 Tax=Vibrio rumoiensis 1S-45 TaxID=1188252 RepID=A0A1E5E3F2_9VIBR|nr:FAD:protein FMN transferase [Vibrio rumoiensis]OEF26313.1 FAD:protein FMN transferase ApbE [Vibrio rumoiensis 1S-45]
MKISLFVVLSLLVLAGCSKPPEQVHLSGPTMGTGYNVKYIVAEGQPDVEDVQKNIDKVLEKVNDEMSTYRPDSELSRFNQHSSNEPFTVSEDTATVVREALRINKLTEGAMDVTVGPIVNLWGFGPEDRPDVVPSDEKLQARRSITGIEHLSETGNALVKDIPELYVDLSSIAKGRGTDEIADYLESIGITNYMVEVGGEIRVKGKNRDGVAWRIAVEKPVANQRSVENIIEPGDMAIATSGDYRNYFEENGVRYSHIINPKTGKPINNKVVSVTVLNPSCMTADGLSTGLMVLGETDGIRIANQHNIPVLYIVKTEDGFKEFSSDAFKPYLKDK